MTSRNLLSGAAAGIMLAACAYPMPRVDAVQDCRSNECFVSVTVLPGTTGPCILEVDFNTVRVDPDGNNPQAGKIIKWQFAPGTTNAAFTENDGIRFDPNSRITCQRTGNGAGYQCENARSTGTWKYDVNATSENARCETFDPYVVNP